MTLHHVAPILRIFDEAVAKSFYVDLLGFSIDWEHRFKPDLPLYMQVSRDDCRLHLSGHHGDCCPGAALRIAVTDIDSLHKELMAKQYKHARPGVEEMPWGSRDMSVSDPSGSHLSFTELTAQ